MPEQISKYPDVTLKVLKGAGGVCGEGARQQILTHCPAERFCSFASGEICVYGIEDIPTMTQIKVEDLAAIVRPRAETRFDISAAEGILLGVVLAAGFAVGRWWPQRRQARRD